ncbi:MAG: membrane protein insertase YidC [Gallionella sp.]|nr:membrane protein insertase YidC [Gallionella sp.]MDD4960007.1 membrane protein insertase YidC [Gallionella sp.]
MDFQRLILVVTFLLSLGLVWEGWQKYQHPELVIAQNTPVSNSDIPTSSLKTAGTLAVPTASTAPVGGTVLHVKTDTLDVEINTLGGDIQRLSLLQHPDGQDKTQPFTLFKKGAGTHNYSAQSGLLGEGMPNHNTVFTAEKTDYVLTGDTQQVRLVAPVMNGVQATKILTFHKGSYLIDVTYELQNQGTNALNTSAYFQLIRDGETPAGGTKMVPTYTGAAVYTDKEKFQKVDFSTMDKGKVEYPKEGTDGWIGMLQHYFVAAWLPKDKTQHEFFTRKLDSGLYSVGVVLPISPIAAGQKGTVTVPLYVGPAQSTLDKIAPGLGLTVDYGWLTIIAAPMFMVMTFLHGIVHNWGVAIILLTVMIKLLFFPLSAASYRSMAKMRVVAPKLEKLKQQYGDDREKLNRAMMDMYKTEKINPLGGCLPMLIQIPVFIGLYWSILESVEMRYAPFFGWIQDLSSADPYYILPLIMGASMILQGRLNPTPPDPLQAKMMQIMPVVFSVVFFFFPAGLVLYSVVNNALSIAQQWYITRGLEAEGLAANH